MSKFKEIISTYKYQSIFVLILLVSLYSNYEKKEIIKKTSAETESIRKELKESTSTILSNKEKYEKEISVLKSKISVLNKKVSMNSNVVEKIVINKDGSKTIDRVSITNKNSELNKTDKSNESVSDKSSSNIDNMVNTKTNTESKEQSDKAKKTEDLKITEEKRGATITSMLWFIGGFVVKALITGLPF